ncbi:MAG: alpha/beta hydrolase-fold protein [Crocinitomicaceae bacterium]|jgi:polyhydroxybutyrate depolymerase
MKNFILICLSLFTLKTNAQVLESISHGGNTRTYMYYKPTAWTPSQQLPLLVVLHGLTQTGGGVMDITQFNQLAEANNFIVCYPNGLNNAWNASMNVTVSSADDKGFIETLVQYFHTNFNTNPQKQYLCGFSNGGFMSHKMACESSECFAAIATVSGNMSDTTYANCNPQYNPAVLHIHGTSDAIVPYDGGPSTGVSVDQTMQKWASFLNCNSTLTSVVMPNPSLTDFSSPERISYSSCTSPLELIKITGGGHQWPGISTLVGGAGIINMDFYSPQVIWDFLSIKSCPSASITESVMSTLQFFPNPANTVLRINSDELLDYQIFNVLGLKIASGRMIKELNIENLERGVYQIYLTLNNESKSFKIFKN